MTYRYAFLTFFMITACSVFLWSTYFLKQQPTLPLVDNIPDAFMEDVVTTILDKEGNPKLEITTPKMVHFSKEDTTRLLTPHLTLYRDSPEPWYITSQYAKAWQGIENVNFWQDVNIQHAADEKSPQTTIKTSTLTVHPNQRTAQTDAPITLLQPNMTVNAVGMFADMNSGDIKLLSNTRGEYFPDGE